MRGCRLLALIAIVLGPLQSGRAQALPPPGAAVGSTNLAVARWIQHRVIAGERLAEIAKRYRVEVAKILEWNELDAVNPMLLAGQKLRIFTSEAAAERRRKSYVVREGDTWARIANRHGVPLARLRGQWNPGVEELLPGDRIVVFIEVEPAQGEPAEVEPDEVAAPPPPATKIAGGAKKPSPLRGALAAVVEVPPPAPAQTASPTTARAPGVAPPSSTKSALAAAPQPTAKPLATAPQPTAKPLAAAPQPPAKPLAAAPQPPAKAPRAAPQSNGKPLANAKTPPPLTLAAVVQQRASANAKAQAAKPRLIVPRLPIVPVPQGAQSAGSPARGRLLNGVQLPPNDALYSIRNPDNSWGSSHAIEQLQRAVARFREDSGFDRELLICDLSREHGGRFRPHSSHRSGRDVDIQLPVKLGLPASTIPREVSQVDWDAAWALVSALVSTGQVKYIFLSRSRQRPLYQAALRAGERPESLRDFVQFPDQSRTALLRHSQGHVKHLHVRFKCAPSDTHCLD